MEQIGKIMAAQSEKLRSMQESKNSCPTQTNMMTQKQEQTQSLRQAYIIKTFGVNDNSITGMCNRLMNNVVFKGSDECFFGDYPTLAEINAAYHRNMTKIVLMLQLFDLSEYCGCKNKLNKRQLEQCAEIIGMTYPYLKISELGLFFARFKAARYGRFYGSVDPLVITTALLTFIQERGDAYAELEAKAQERKQAMQKKKAVTWEEYCARHGINGRQSPLLREDK